MQITHIACTKATQNDKLFPIPVVSIVCEYFTFGDKIKAPNAKISI